MMLKTIILIGGPMKGTRFRPLSLETPKPLFPVAGFPVIYHHIEAASQVDGMMEVILIGFYQPNETLKRFITLAQQEFKVQIRYLQEYTALGTAGGLYHFRDQILAGNPDYFFMMNADTCGDFPLKDMLVSHMNKPMGTYCTILGTEDMLVSHMNKPMGTYCTILGTEATRQQSLTYGCIVENKETHEIMHYVEKPETFISTTINCGIYLFSPCIFAPLEVEFKKNLEQNYNDEAISGCDYMSAPAKEVIRMEQDIFVPLAATGKLYVFHTNKFWSQIKSAGAAIYANRHYLDLYKENHPERLAKNKTGGPKIIGDVYIHSSAQVHETAVLGPNVTIGKNCVLGEGVRVRESLLLEGSILQDHSCILYSIIGWNSQVGIWTRIEGTPNDPNPNKPFAKLEAISTFTNDGKLNPSITVIGSDVQVPAEVIILNSIVLPNKELNGSYRNQIIL